MLLKKCRLSLEFLTILRLSNLLGFHIAYRHSTFRGKKTSLFSITRMCPFFPHDGNCIHSSLLNNSSQRLQLKSCSLTTVAVIFFPNRFSIMHNVISFWLLPQSILSSFVLSFPACLDQRSQAPLHLHPHGPMVSRATSSFHVTTAFFLVKILTYYNTVVIALYGDGW